MVVLFLFLLFFFLGRSFICDSYRLCRAAKLLMSLGYGNFSTVIQYDIYVMAMKYFEANESFDLSEFSDSDYSLDLISFESAHILNSPNLSLFPLLAYHKICDDHYRNEKWQSFEPWTCNIDYLRPADNMNAKSFIDISTFTTLMSSILDLENSNLPIDYFTSVLPRAQYGDESAAAVSVDGANTFFKLQDPNNDKIGPVYRDWETDRKSVV